MKRIVAEENAGFVWAMLEKMPRIFRQKCLAGCAFFEYRKGRIAGPAGRQAEECP
jgi:hypothetical protein